jgi:ribonuclease R
MIAPEQLLQHMDRLPHRRASFKQLLRELRIGGPERQELKAMLRELVRKRKLVESRHFFELPPMPRAGGSATAPAEARVQPGPDEIVGRISVHRDGYGFVLPIAPAPVSAAAADGPRGGMPGHPRAAGPALGTVRAPAGDLFIPPPFLANAMHGDTVLARILRSTEEGRAEGKVLRILKREHATVVGTFHCGRTFNYVTPFDDRLREPVVIPRGQELPSAGLDLPSRHRVLGAEARAAKAAGNAALAGAPLDASDLEGAVVDVEITAYASPHSEARGRVIEVLGHPGDFGIDVEIVIRKYHLPHRFPEQVLHAAEEIAPTLPAEELARRRDFRHLPIVTIDGETARDFDDAVYVVGLPNGNFELQVHIADVAWYVEDGGAIDREARLRGTSVYFPDRAVPMLPAQLSTDLCSLRPRTDRLVMSCIMEISRAGDVVGYEIVPGVIRSAERMTYADVNAILSGDAELRARYETLIPLFERMLELERILNRRRMARGAIDFDIPEPQIEFDEQGIMRSIVKAERNVANRIIEEFMLTANETVARWLREQAVPSVYRIHQKPMAKKVAEFEEVASSFGYSLGAGPLPVRKIQRRIAGRLRTIEVPVEEEVDISPRNYQKLAASVVGKPEERILTFLMLRSLPQARYSAENIGHFALATDCYTHFTSPIRRYPDLLVHRLLTHLLPPGGARHAAAQPGSVAKAASATAAGGADSAAPRHARGRRARSRVGANEPQPTAPAQPGLWEADQLELLAREASDAERRADDAERELMEWKKVRYMETRMGEQFPALILNVARSGFFVELTDQFIEGFVPVDAVGDDRYFYHPELHALIGQRSKRTYRIGGRLEVQVDRIDPVRHRVEFTPVAAAPIRGRRAK